MKIDSLKEIIFPAVAQYKEMMDEPESFIQSPNTVLLGEGSVLSSIGLVNFLMVVEEQIEKMTGTSIVLASSKAMSRKNSPFRSLESLAAYVTELLDERAAG